MSTRKNNRKSTPRSTAAEQLRLALRAEGMHFRRCARDVYGVPTLALKKCMLAISLSAFCQRLEKLEM